MSDVIAQIEGRIGCITLNRPKALNALSLDMVRALTPSHRHGQHLGIGLPIQQSLRQCAHHVERQGVECFGAVEGDALLMNQWLGWRQNNV